MVTAAALLLAAALALWPGRRCARRVRLAAVRDGPARGRARAFRPARLPLEALCGAGAAAVGAAASTVLVAALAAAGAALVVRGWRRRCERISEHARLAALTEALGALAAELRAGRPLESAAGTAVAACADAATGAALARALRAPAGAQARPGTAADTALVRVAAAVRLSARTGCSLAAVVSAVEDDLRARSRQLGELHAATAGPRASAALLAGLPLLGLAMGAGVGADPWRVLTATSTGQVLFVLGVALEAAGVAWSGRLVRRALR